MSCEVLWDVWLCGVSQSVPLPSTATSLFFSKHLILHYSLGPWTFIITAFVYLKTNTEKKLATRAQIEDPKIGNPRETESSDLGTREHF